MAHHFIECSGLNNVFENWGNRTTTYQIQLSNKLNVWNIIYYDTDTDNYFIVSSGVYIVKYIFKSWNNQQVKLSYKRSTFTL